MPKKPDERALRYLKFYAYRMEEREEDWIASELEFGSPEALYQQLRQDGFPICTVCGETPVQPGHCERPRQQRQPDLGSGRRVRLPDASRAQSLFRQALEALDEYIYFVDIEESWLEGNVEEGRFKGKHFMTHSVDRDPHEVAWREEFTEEQWKELCEQHGVDPQTEQVILSAGSATPGGVSRTPSTFLTALIAAYVLAYQPLTPLINALHHEPDSAAWDELNTNIDKLRKVAGHLAARVRGGFVGTGRGVEEISPEEHYAAWLIQAFEREGAGSDEEIHEQLKRTFPSFAWLTPKEIDRIRRERLEQPH